jgi:hypothetical protein
MIPILKINTALPFKRFYQPFLSSFSKKLLWLDVFAASQTPVWPEIAGIVAVAIHAGFINNCFQMIDM